MAEEKNEKDVGVAETKLQDALTRLRDDVTRVEIWAGAMASFSKPPPDYEPQSLAADRYRLHRKPKQTRTRTRRRTMTQVKIAALSALISLAGALPATAQQAVDYPWCLENSRGSKNCGFTSFQQCRASASGDNSAVCVRNAFFGTSPRSR